MEIQEIQRLVVHQVKCFFGAKDGQMDLLNEKNIKEAIIRTENCLNKMNNKYYVSTNYPPNGESRINLYNSVMNCIFLYWLSRNLFLSSDFRLADQIYYLNKMLNSVELFYEVTLPSVWSCEHPLGSVMGRASYGDYFFFYQGCTVGGNIRKDGAIVYPVIGDHVKMYSNSKILGNSHIGDHTIISANCYIKDQDVPSRVIVFGQSPNLEFKENCF